MIGVKEPVYWSKVRAKSETMTTDPETFEVF